MIKFKPNNLLILIASLALCACTQKSNILGSIIGSNNGASSIGNPTSSTPNPTPVATASPAPIGNAQIILNTGSTIFTITPEDLGTNLGTWYNVTLPGLTQDIQSTGAKLVRWPGGSYSDQYHWQTPQASCGGAYVNPASTWSTFMNDVVIPGNFEVAITLNYGSNSACNGGGDPNEGAAWVANAKANNYNIKYWTIGNEVNGSWEYDLHIKAHDPGTYASALSGPTGYYQLIKAQNPNAQVGAVVAGVGSWDNIVLSQAQYDYVEFHWYAQNTTNVSDSYLLNTAPGALTSSINMIKQELTSAGKSSTPIMLGEFNSIAESSNLGTQSMSIVNALFTGMAFGELLNDGVSIATWFMAVGAGSVSNNNSSMFGALSNYPVVYGFQNYGSYGTVVGPGDFGGGTGPFPPVGTVTPSGWAQYLVSHFAKAGNTILPVTVNSSLANVKAYGATQGSGYAMMLFNLSQTSMTTASLNVSGASRSSFSASTVTYGKAQYDNSQNNIWTGPLTQSLGSVGTGLSITLPPWSMTVLTLQ